MSHQGGDFVREMGEGRTSNAASTDAYQGLTISPELRERLRADRCAVVVVDVQNDFCHENGATATLGYDTGLIRLVMPNVHRIIDLAREVGVPRIYLQVGHDNWTDTPSWTMRYARSDQTSIPMGGGVARRGTWGAEFFELQPKPDEVVIRKYRYSGFAYTPLELVLRSRGADTVVLMGTQTNACVVATATDALTRDFYPVVVADCTASGSEEQHRAALEDIRERLGLVVPSDVLEEIWRSDWARGFDEAGTMR